MIKKNKGLIILIVVIVVLASVYALVTFLKTGVDDETPSDTDESIEIYNIDTQTIKNIKINSFKESYTLSFYDSVSIPELPGSYIDEEKAYATRQGLSIITTDEIISQNADNASEYGFDNPSYTVEIITEDENGKMIEIGDASPVGNGYYCKVKGEDRIFIVSNYKYEYIAYPSSYYRTMTFFEVDRNAISDITLDVYNKHTLTFKENMVTDTDAPHNVFDRYQMTSPYTWPASSNMVGKILDSVTQLEVLEYVSENSENMAEFGFAPYVAKLTFAHDGGQSDTIYFGNNKESIIYIRTDKDDKIYGISAEPFSYLEVEPFSFLSDFAFLRNIMTVKHINYTHNNVTADFIITALDNENVDVKKNGKLMSQEKFKELYTELISISVAGAYDGVFPGKAFLSYTFDYNDLSTEKVEFYKIDERRAALSVNGKCQFYVNMVALNEKLEKIDGIIASN